jgi:hypothetical protein
LPVVLSHMTFARWKIIAVLRNLTAALSFVNFARVKC